MNQRSEHIRKQLERLVGYGGAFKFADVAQIICDSGKRTQGMDESEIYYEASESLACLTDEELEADWSKKFIPPQSLEDAQIEDLEEQIACAYKQLRKRGQSKKSILGYLEISEGEL